MVTKDVPHPMEIEALGELDSEEFAGPEAPKSWSYNILLFLRSIVSILLAIIIILILFKLCIPYNIDAQDIPHPMEIAGEKELAELESEEFAGPEAPW